MSSEFSFRVINGAQAHIQEPPVNQASFAGSPLERRVETFYDEALEYVLDHYPARKHRRWETLIADPAITVPVHTHCYPLAEDFLEICELRAVSETPLITPPKITDFEVRSSEAGNGAERRILCVSHGPKVQAEVFHKPHADQMSPIYRNCVSLKLALFLCGPASKSVSLYKTLDKKLETELAKAAKRDGKQGGEDQDPIESYWLEGRDQFGTTGPENPYAYGRPYSS